MRKLSKSLTITLLAILVFLLVSILIPLLWPDASKDYVGVKKEVADYAVSNAWGGISGTNYATAFGTIKISVEDVAVGKPNDKLCNGEFSSKTDPTAGDHFLATVGYRTLFGALLKTQQFHICIDR